MTRHYWIYMLECSNGTYYTGIALDVGVRFRAHRRGTGARYTRMHPPLRVAQCWRVGGGRGEAQKVEAVIQSMTRAAKEDIMARPSLLSGIVRRRVPGGPSVRAVPRASLRRLNESVSEHGTDDAG